MSKNLRVKLSKEITKNEKKIFIKYLDEKIKSQSTFYLLKYLKNKNRKDKLFFLIGADNLIKFHTWKNWKEIPSLAKIVVFDRQNYTTKALRSIASKRLEKVKRAERVERVRKGLNGFKKFPTGKNQNGFVIFLLKFRVCSGETTIKKT